MINDAYVIKPHTIPKVWGSESFQAGGHRVVLGEYHAQDGHESSTPLSTYFALYISYIWMFICILYRVL